MPESDCICGPYVVCLWHYGEAKMKQRRERERPYRKGPRRARQQRAKASA